MKKDDLNFLFMFLIFKIFKNEFKRSIIIIIKRLGLFISLRAPKYTSAVARLWAY